MLYYLVLLSRLRSLYSLSWGETNFCCHHPFPFYRSVVNHLTHTHTLIDWPLLSGLEEAISWAQNCVLKTLTLHKLPLSGGGGTRLTPPQPEGRDTPSRNSESHNWNIRQSSIPLFFLSSDSFIYRYFTIRPWQLQCVNSPTSGHIIL